MAKQSYAKRLTKRLAAPFVSSSTSSLSSGEKKAAVDSSSSPPAPAPAHSPAPPPASASQSNRSSVSLSKSPLNPALARPGLSQSHSAASLHSSRNLGHLSSGSTASFSQLDSDPVNADLPGLPVSASHSRSISLSAPRSEFPLSPSNTKEHHRYLSTGIGLPEQDNYKLSQNPSQILIKRSSTSSSSSSSNNVKRGSSNIVAIRNTTSGSSSGGGGSVGLSVGNTSANQSYVSLPYDAPKRKQESQLGISVSNIPSSIAPGISPKIKQRFDELESLITNSLAKRLDSIDSENLRLLDELNAKYKQLNDMNSSLSSNLTVLQKYLTEMDESKQKEIETLNSSDLFKNLNDLNARLKGVRNNLTENKAKLNTFDSSLLLMEDAKKRSIVAQKTRRDVIITILACVFLILVLRICKSFYKAK